jgi:hypothetical protein
MSPPYTGLVGWTAPSGHAIRQWREHFGLVVPALPSNVGQETGSASPQPHEAAIMQMQPDHADAACPVASAATHAWSEVSEPSNDDCTMPPSVSSPQILDDLDAPAGVAGQSHVHGRLKLP